MVVSVSGAVADVAAYAETVLMKTAFHLGIFTNGNRRDSAAITPKERPKADRSSP
jgi:hypothetical protein